MEIQQHDDVVVDVAGSRQGFAKLLREGEVLQGEREAPGAVVLLPSLPSIIYRPPGGGGAGPGTHLHGGAAAKREEQPHPQGGEAALAQESLEELFHVQGQKGRR